MAEKARDLQLTDPAFSGGLGDAVAAKAKAQAAAEKPKEGEAPKDEAKIAAEGTKRLAGLTGAAFAGKPVASYDRDTAGTVGLYRPVHREITSKQSGVKGDLLANVDLGGARQKLVDYAVSEPKNESLKDGAIADLRAGVRKRFVEEIESHSALIRDAYKIELKEFMMINRSKPAAAKMGAVIERVGGTLKQLRTESLSLVE